MTQLFKVPFPRVIQPGSTTGAGAERNSFNAFGQEMGAEAYVIDELLELDVIV